MGQICGKCGAPMPDNAVFCENCGNVLQQNFSGGNVCRRCGKALNREDKFCVSCGEPVFSNGNPEAPGSLRQGNNGNSRVRPPYQGKGKNTKKTALIVGCAAAIIIAAVSLFLLKNSLFGKGEDMEQPVAQATELGNEGITENEESEMTEKDVINEYGVGDHIALPRIVPDSGMEAGQKVTWDCVWFGSYPQAEVIPSGVEYTALDAILRRDGDVIVSDSVYSALQNASGWDENNDIALNGEKYRRLKKEDATYATSDNSECYNWDNSTDYHYFKYEPIKWRVLHTDGKQALLLSDVALDGQKYHTEWGDVTWETSMVRSWLNGYGAGNNQQSVDYSRKNFIGSAFTVSEQEAIINSSLENADNIEYGTSGGSTTTDKIFLPAVSEVWNTDKAESYGFVKSGGIHDETRRCQSSTYAKAMGVWSYSSTDYVGNGWWWLRSPGDYSFGAMRVGDNGRVYGYGDSVHESSSGVRPALSLNLSSANLCTYAGTVCSDGTYEEANGGTGAP